MNNIWHAYRSCAKWKICTKLPLRYDNFLLWNCSAENMGLQYLPLFAWCPRHWWAFHFPRYIVYCNHTAYATLSAFSLSSYLQSIIKNERINYKKHEQENSHVNIHIYFQTCFGSFCITLIQWLFYSVVIYFPDSLTTLSLNHTSLFTLNQNEFITFMNNTNTMVEQDLGLLQT